ncbi:MAG: choice-of-anchor V domain-containing protein [Bacteroidales bacterium]
MKKFYYYLIPIGSILFAMLLTSFGGSNLKNSTGAPAGNTNSPGDGQNCTHCMGGSAAQVSGWITSNIPITGYVPGTTYTITVTAPGSARKGFQVSPQHASGFLIGTLIAGTGTKLVGGGKYVTHSSAKTIDPAVWNFQWTAPAEGAGNVVFYGSIAIGQQATKVTTYNVYQSTVGLTENHQAVIRIFPNPVRDRITVAFPVDEAGTLRINLLNLRGEPLSTLYENTCPAGDFTQSFPIRQSPGTYLLGVTRGGKSTFSKVLVID